MNYITRYVPRYVTRYVASYVTKYVTRYVSRDITSYVTRYVTRYVTNVRSGARCRPPAGDAVQGVPWLPVAGGRPDRLKISQIVYFLVIVIGK